MVGLLMDGLRNGAGAHWLPLTARVWRPRRSRPVKLQAMFAKPEGCLTGGGPE